MTEQQYRPVKFVDLFNSCDASAVPDGFAYEADNASFANGVVEGGPRYGDVWAWGSAHANDVAYGFGYAEYEGTAEYLVVMKRNGEAVARLSSVDPSTGTFTAVSTGSANAQNLPADGHYLFKQVQGHVYVCHVGTSTTMWRRAVGDLATTAAFEVWTPTYNRGAGFGGTVEKPPYRTVTFGAATLVDPGGLGPTLSLVGTSTFRINFAGATAGGTFYVVLESTDGWDIEHVDVFGDEFLKSANVTGPVNTAIALSEDSTSTINAAWCASLDWIDNEPHINTAGSTWKTTEIITSHVPSNRASRKPIYRIALKFTNGGAQFSTGAGTYDLVGLTMGGIRLWDLTPPGAGTTIGYAVRWAKKKGSPFTYTPLVRLPDQLVDNGGTGDDMLGTQPAGATRPYMGTALKLSVPYDPHRANDGYDWVQFWRQESATTGNWYQVAEVQHTGALGDLLSVYDTTLQSTVDANGTAASPGQTGPSTDADCIGVWKDHFLIGVDLKCFASTAGAPGEFVPPPDEIAGAYDPDQETLGATFYVTRGRVTGATAFAGLDPLMIGTIREIVAVIGDNILTASPPRGLANSFGLCSSRGMVDYLSGVAAAHLVGAYYYDAARVAGSIEDNLLSFEEMTAAVRKSWARLIGGGSGSGLVAVYGDDELWFWNTEGGSTRFVRYTRPMIDPATGASRRRWEEGTWPFGVVGGVYVPGNGTRILLANGKVARLGSDAAGDAYLDDDGTQVTWTATSGERIAGREETVAICALTTGDSTDKVSLTVSVDDGEGTGGLTAQTAIVLEPGRHWAENVAIRPGVRWQYELSGKTDKNKVLELVLVVEDRERGDGN